MIERKRFFILFLLFALLLTGCGREQCNAVGTLSCVRPENMPELLCLGDEKLLIMWNEGDSTQLVLADIKGDSVIAREELNGSWLLLDECFEYGGFAVYEWNSLSWLFFDSSLNTLGSFCCEDVGGVFSHDGSDYYHIADGCLCRTDTVTEHTEPVELPHTLSCTDIVGISPHADTLALHFELSPFSGGCGTAIVDLERGDFICLCDENYLPHFTEKGLAFRSFDAEAASYGVSFGNEARFYSAEAKLFSEIGSELCPLNGTDYMIGSGKNGEAMLFRLGTELSVSTLSQVGVSDRVRAACSLGSDRPIVAAVYNGTSFHILLIDPALLSFTDFSETKPIASLLSVDSSCAEAYRLALGGAPLPEYLSDLRAHADRLEDKYGIAIFLSSQCEPLHELFTYDFTTTDLMSRDDEAEMTESLLCALDETLALYPEGFFRQFRGKADTGGIRFLTVGAIESDCGIIGETAEQRGWQNIMLDVRQEFFGSIICHELWHAMENKITAEDMYAFDNDIWADYNPEGFSYYFDTSQTDPEANRWTLYRADRSEPLCFTDAYARQNEHEDRARLMEYMMSIDYFIPDLTGSSFTDGKLQIMFSAIREHFDIDGADEPLWEQNYRKYKE